MSVAISNPALNDSTPVQLDSLAGTAGRNIIVDNTDASITISLVAAPSGSQAGFDIKAGAHASFPLSVRDHIYAVSASGAPTCQVLEVAIGDIEDDGH